MTERNDHGAPGPEARPRSDADALAVLRGIWEARDQSSADLDRVPKAKVCRNMKNIGFGGLGGGGDADSTAVPVGEDMRTAWRDLLRREGKLNEDAPSVVEEAEAARRHH